MPRNFQKTIIYVMIFVLVFGTFLTGLSVYM